MAAATQDFSFAPEPDAMATAMEAFSAFLADQAVPDSMVNRVMMALDELLTNSLRHTAPGNGRRVDLKVQVGRGAVTVDLFDDGPAFDPTQVPPPDLDLALEDRPIGGLGVHLVRQFMDVFQYERAGNRNHVTIAKHFKQDDP